MRKRFLPLLAIPLFLAACASDQDLADQAAVERSGVSPAIYDKMIHDDPLGISDVAALSRARVNDGVIVRYIRDHDTVYVLSRSDIGYPISIGIGVGGGYYGGRHW